MNPNAGGWALVGNDGPVGKSSYLLDQTGKPARLYSGLYFAILAIIVEEMIIWLNS